MRVLEKRHNASSVKVFPSFSEGLSLREELTGYGRPIPRRFPFLFGGTFIEGFWVYRGVYRELTFPFLFGGTFIEGRAGQLGILPATTISLPFRRDFH